MLHVFPVMSAEYIKPFTDYSVHYGGLNQQHCQFESGTFIGGLSSRRVSGTQGASNYIQL